MKSFEYLQNKYAEVANNFEGSLGAFNNNFYGTHKMSKEELAKDYEEYSKLFGDEILFQANMSVDEDNKCLEKYEDWMLDGD